MCQCNYCNEEKIIKSTTIYGNICFECEEKIKYIKEILDNDLIFLHNNINMNAITVLHKMINKINNEYKIQIVKYNKENAYKFNIVYDIKYKNKNCNLVVNCEILENSYNININIVSSDFMIIYKRYIIINNIIYKNENVELNQNAKDIGTKYILQLKDNCISDSFDFEL